jgi:cytochrome c(L)
VAEDLIIPGRVASPHFACRGLDLIPGALADRDASERRPFWKSPFMRVEKGKRLRRFLAGALALVLGAGLPSAALSQDQGAKKLNKYNGNAEAIKEGRALYLKYGCSGCHGVGGGGGMGPPVTDDVWKFGSSDEVLFKLIKGQVPNQTMPAVFGTQMTDDEVWKVIAFIRSIYAGDPGKVNW